jgi:peroxiredoxin family protein
MSIENKNINETIEMNEGMYLEAMNQLKEINEKRDKEYEKLKEENLDIKKELISCYGVVRMIDMMYSDTEEPVLEIGILIESLREYLSQYTENKIICRRIEIE